jgi:hypothetical protein
MMQLFGRVKNISGRSRSRKNVKTEYLEVMIEGKYVLNTHLSTYREAGAICKRELLIMITLEDTTTLIEECPIDPDKEQEASFNELR